MILVTGSLAFDYIMDYQGVFSDHIMPDKIHTLNVSFYLETLNKQRGGNAGNISYTLSLLKVKSGILSAAGSDFTEYKKFLDDADVITSYIKIVENEPTGSAFIMTDKNDNQISGFYPGAIKYTNTLSLKTVTPKPEFVIVTPDNSESMALFCTESQQLSIPYMFDPGMQLPALSDEQLTQGIKGAEILIANDYEIALIKQRIGEDLLKGVKLLITTLGDQGSIIKNSKEEIRISVAKPTEVLDPTGAGDAYRAGFICGFQKGLPLKTCGQMGSVASCYAIEKYGTTSHTFTIDEFKVRYKENFGQDLNI